MMVIFLFNFLWSEVGIAEMQQVFNDPPIWKPSAMHVKAQALPKIASYALSKVPALTYAELLRQYTTKSLITGLGEQTKVGAIDCHWYQDQTTSGYFCPHDGLISFVVTARSIEIGKLQTILKQFKSNYEMAYPKQQPPVIPAQTGTQRKTLTLPEDNRPFTVIDQKFLERYEERSLRLYPEFYLPAVPHIHAYTDFSTFHSYVFKLKNKQDFFINVCFYPEITDQNMLFRPHAYLAKGPNRVEQTWPNIQATITFADETSKTISGQVIVHADGVASPAGLDIGNFYELITKGPFISHMTYPEDVTTLHILIPPEEMVNLTPESPAELLSYLQKKWPKGREHSFIWKILQLAGLPKSF